MDVLLFIFFICIFTMQSLSPDQTGLRLRQTGSLHVTGVQSDPPSPLFIKWRSGVSEVS